MIRVYIKRKNEIAGHVFIARSSVQKDVVAILHFGFVRDGFITEKEWNNSQELIVDKFELHITESYIDGRCKIARNAKRFNWKDVLKMKPGEVFKPVAYKPVCNFFSIEIEISNCGSMVRYRIGNKGAVSAWKEIYYTKGGRPFFKMHDDEHARSKYYFDRRYYLDEFLKF